MRHGIMLIGYARVSKTDGSQSLDQQCDALETASVDAIIRLPRPRVPATGSISSTVTVSAVRL